MQDYIASAKKSYNEIPEPDMAKMHAHDSYELYCFLRGDAKYSVEGSFYELRPGDIMIMKRAEAHCLIINSLEPYERYVIHFYPEAILGEDREDILRFIDERPLGKFNRFPASLFKNKHWEYYFEKICGGKPYEQRIFLTALIFELAEAFPEIKNEEQKTENFSNIIAYINEHISENISLDHICSYAFLSKSQLNRKFKAITGSTVWEYITVKKLM
ncbi:MAG: AraC family ligand binding domain-containing protein, partial [Acutalibacteraceae bacterium]